MTTYRWVPPAAGLLFLAGSALLAKPTNRSSDEHPHITATLSEWKIELSQMTIMPGSTTLNVTNAGSIPHALEIEGEGAEWKTGLIQPGSTAALRVKLPAGTYELYCPVGNDSHKKLGMETHLTVTGRGHVGYSQGSRRSQAPARQVRIIQVTGGGPVIQILPGPFPFADSAEGVFPAFGEERATLESQARNGPYSNNVARITGSFHFAAWDRGAAGDSIAGVAAFATRDAAQWRLVLDRVQTKDVPHHPRFGGVILGLYYHGNTTVHTPLVPKINSAVALWAFGHLYRNGALVTDSAAVHVMLLSRTRRESDFALQCWDCSSNKVDELQLQVQPPPGGHPFDAPGGFLFVNWEESGSRQLAG